MQAFCLSNRTFETHKETQFTGSIVPAGSDIPEPGPGEFPLVDEVAQEFSGAGRAPENCTLTGPSSGTHESSGVHRGGSAQGAGDRLEADARRGHGDPEHRAEQHGPGTSPAQRGDVRGQADG